MTLQIKGQSTIETTIIFMIVVGAFLTMYLYFKGAIQGNWRSNADTFSARQYDGNDSSSSDSGVVYKNSVLGISTDGDAVPDVTYSNFMANPTDPSNLEQTVKNVTGWGVYSK